MPHLLASGRRLLLWSGLLVGGLAACGPDPEATAAAAYVAAMAPVVAENAALDRQFLDLAGKLRSGSLAGAGVATQVEANLLPSARAVVEKAKQVQPAIPALRAVHDKGVEAWSARAEAYAGVTAAYKAADLAAFDAALSAEKRARDAEAAWFAELDAALAPYGQRLDPFPAPASAPAP